jgi:hypothetical protein
MNDQSFRMIINSFEVIVNRLDNVLVSLNDGTVLAGMVTFQVGVLAILLPVSLDVLARVSDRYKNPSMVKKISEGKGFSKFPYFLIGSICLTVFFSWFPFPAWTKVFPSVLFAVSIVGTVLLTRTTLNYVTDMSNFLFNKFVKDTQNILDAKSKAKNKQVEFQSALDAMTAILAYETQQANNTSVTEYLEQFESLTEQFLKLEKDNPELYKELAFDKAYEALATQNDDFLSSPQVYYAVYAVTFTKIVENLFRIVDVAFEINNDTIAHKTISAIIKILQSLTTQAGNGMLVEIVLPELSNRHVQFAKSNNEAMRTLFITWYTACVFKETNFEQEYLAVFNQGLYKAFQYIIDAGNQTVYQQFVAVMHRGIGFPERENPINQFNRFHANDLQFLDIPKETFSSIKEIFTGFEIKGILREPEDLIKQLNEAAERITEKIKQAKPSILSEFEKWINEAKKDLKNNYHYNTLIETLYRVASYCLFKKQYGYIHYLWEFHQPSGSAIGNLGPHPMPNNLNGLLFLYTELLASNADKWFHQFVSEHFDSRQYWLQYFLLFSIRLLSKTPESEKHIHNISVEHYTDSGQRANLANSTLPKLKQALEQLKLEPDELKQLGFDTSTIKEEQGIAFLFGGGKAKPTVFEGYKTELEAILDKLTEDLENAEITACIETPLNTLKIEAFKTEFLAAFKQSAALRQFLIDNNAFEDETGSEEFSSESSENLYGTKTTFERAVFFEKWHVSYLNSNGVETGRKLGCDENEILSQKIKAKCTEHTGDLNSAIQALLKDKESNANNVVLFISADYQQRFLGNPNFTPAWHFKEKNESNQFLEGLYDFQGAKIPIYRFQRLQQGCLVLDRTRLGQLVQYNVLQHPDFKEESEDKLLGNQFFFDVTDLSKDEARLQKETDHLTDSVEKEKRIQELRQQALLEICECVEFVPAENFKGYALAST